VDRGLDELVDRRGADEVSITWLAERLREFVDAYPEYEVQVDRLATWLARLPDDD
jgi:DNA-binding transcriptional LysR family regulator